MWSLPQLRHVMCGSGYNGSGAAGAVAVISWDRDWMVEGSVVERGKAGGDARGGVPLRGARGCRAPVGSVVLRDDADMG